jgi:hypothetical protein
MSLDDTIMKKSWDNQTWPPILTFQAIPKLPMNEILLPVYASIVLSSIEYHRMVSAIGKIMEKMKILSDEVINHSFTTQKKTFLNENKIFFTKDGFLNVVTLITFERNKFIAKANNVEVNDGLYAQYLHANYNTYYQFMQNMATIAQGIASIYKISTSGFNTTLQKNGFKYISQDDAMNIIFKLYQNIDVSITEELDRYLKGQLDIDEKYTEVSLLKFDEALYNVMNACNFMHNSFKTNPF